jgi:acyl carrier protein
MKFRENILNALQSIDINVNGLNDDDMFGENLGMDSQEIAEFLFVLEKKLKIKLPKEFFNRQMTIKEASYKLSEYINNMMAEPA